MSDAIASSDALPRGTVLRGYSIREVLGQGGFGIVYRARHIELGNVVAIKEYLPAELAVRVGSSVRPRSASYVDFYRDGLRRFRKEGQALVALHNQSGIVSCRDFFRCNNTAYLVMEFEAGMPLSEVLRVRESEGRPFSEKDMMDLAIPLLKGLRHVHAAGIVHRDIKPSNLLLRESNGEPVLIDFGAAKHDAATQTKSMAPRTPGYAAWEQIVPDGKLGPWTDIYAIGVLLWRIVAGGSRRSERRYPVPVEGRMDAISRGEPDPMPSAVELGKGRFNIKVLALIDCCLSLWSRDRVRDCSELLGLLGYEGYSLVETAKFCFLDLYRKEQGKWFWQTPLDCQTLQEAVEKGREFMRIWYVSRAGSYEFSINIYTKEVHRETLEISYTMLDQTRADRGEPFACVRLDCETLQQATEEARAKVRDAYILRPGSYEFAIFCVGKKVRRETVVIGPRAGQWRVNVKPLGD